MADDRSAMAELRNILVSREPLMRALRRGRYRGLSVDAAAARLIDAVAPVLHDKHAFGLRSAAFPEAVRADSAPATNATVNHAQVPCERLLQHTLKVCYQIVNCMEDKIMLERRQHPRNRVYYGGMVAFNARTRRSPASCATSARSAQRSNSSIRPCVPDQVDFEIERRGLSAWPHSSGATERGRAWCSQRARDERRRSAGPGRASCARPNGQTGSSSRVSIGFYPNLGPHEHDRRRRRRHPCCRPRAESSAAALRTILLACYRRSTRS
jgi:hypothetical protein